MLLLLLFLKCTFCASTKSVSYRVQNKAEYKLSPTLFKGDKLENMESAFFML